MSNIAATVTNNDINAKNRDGDTLLHLTDDIEEFKTLLSTQGIDVNIQNNSGNTALHELIEQLRDYHPQTTLSDWSDYDQGNLQEVIDNYTNLIKILISDPRVDFTIKNNRGETAYQIAPRSIKILISSERDKRTNRTLAEVSLFTGTKPGDTTLNEYDDQGNITGTKTVPINPAPKLPGDAISHIKDFLFSEKQRKNHHRKIIQRKQREQQEIVKENTDASSSSSSNVNQGGRRTHRKRKQRKATLRRN